MAVFTSDWAPGVVVKAQAAPVDGLVDRLEGDFLRYIEIGGDLTR